MSQRPAQTESPEGGRVYTQGLFPSETNKIQRRGLLYSLTHIKLCLERIHKETSEHKAWIVAILALTPEAAILQSTPLIMTKPSSEAAKALAAMTPGMLERLREGPGLLYDNLGQPQSPLDLFSKQVITSLTDQLDQIVVELDTGCNRLEDLIQRKIVNDRPHQSKKYTTKAMKGFMSELHNEYFTAVEKLDHVVLMAKGWYEGPQGEKHREYFERRLTVKRRVSARLSMLEEESACEDVMAQVEEEGIPGEDSSSV